MKKETVAAIVALAVCVSILAIQSGAPEQAVVFSSAQTVAAYKAAVAAGMPPAPYALLPGTTWNPTPQQVAEASKSLVVLNGVD